MGKFEHKNKKSPAAWVAAGVVLAVVLIAAAFIANQDSPGSAGVPLATAPPGMQGAESETTVLTEPVDAGASNADAEALVFPMLLEDGMLEIGSLFQSSGINPDFEDQEGTDIASIALTNTSEVMLSETTVIATLADGTEIRFCAAWLPAGKTAMVFAEDNIALPDDAVCVAVTCEAVWDETGHTGPEGVSASADGMMITITNDTAQDIPELIVYCRTPLGEEYFGGIAYEYKVTDLPAKGSTTILAADCIMGLAEVVRIEIPQE